jgi:hypothetical protein
VSVELKQSARAGASGNQSQVDAAEHRIKGPNRSKGV